MRLTGEFVASDEALELRVYVQRGRVAWATSSRDRDLFVRVLRETTRLSEELIEEISELCLRENRHLGETLVASRLATVAQVRTALRAEIEITLELLERAGPMRTVFQPLRSTSTYDDALTFEPQQLDRLHLEDVVPEMDAALVAALG